MSSNCAWPSRLASTSRVTTILLRLLRQPVPHSFPQARSPFLQGDGFVYLVVQPLGLLFRDLFPDAFLDMAVLLREFVAVLVDVLDNGVVLFARQTRHGPVDEMEIVTAVKVVENIHDGQSMPFDLRPAAEIDNPDLV